MRPFRRKVGTGRSKLALRLYVGADRTTYMKGFVYILESQAGKFYIGSTTDIKRRFRTHELGHTQTTRNMGEVKIVLVQEYETLGEARKIERRLKNLKRKDYLEKIVGDGYIRLEATRPSFNG